MRNPVWDEIMRSPLDPDPDEERRLLASIAPLALAVVVGLGLGIFAGNAKEPTATTPAIATTTTSTSEAPPPDPIVPSGYADASGVGLKALAVFNHTDNLYVVVNSATRSDLDRVNTDEFHIAEWILSGDGLERTASRAIDSDVAPGVRLIEFPGVNSLPVSLPALHIREATEMVVRTGCNGCAATSVDAAEGELVIEGLQLPYSLPEPVFVAVGPGITLSIDLLEITDEWGYAEWHVLDQNDARVRVSLVIVFEGTDDPATERQDPTLLVPTAMRGPTQQNPVGSNPDPFTRSGTQGLDRVGEIMSADNRPTQIVLDWNVEWQHPVGEPITLPLDNVADLGSID